MTNKIDFIKAFKTKDLKEFMDQVFPESWGPIKARIIESGAEYGTTDRFAPKWSPIPYTIRKGDSEIETALKSTIFRVHDCLHQLWGLPIPSRYDEDNFYMFKRAWMCSEVATLTLTEFIYCEWLYNTQPHVKKFLEKRNTLLFKSTTELRYKTPKDIAIRLDQLLHKKIKPRWIRDNQYGNIFLEDFIPMLEDDRTNIDHNWNLLKSNISLKDLKKLPNQRYNSHLDGLELTSWMIDDFYHTLNTDDEVDVELGNFNRVRRQKLIMPEGWNEPKSYSNKDINVNII